MSVKVIKTSYKRLDLYDLGEIPEDFWEGFPQVYGHPVFVKSNLVIPPTEWESASTTRVEVVKLVIRKLIEEGASEITVGDCGFKNQWEKTISLSGYDSLLKTFKEVRLIGLQEPENFHRYNPYRLIPSMVPSLGVTDSQQSVVELSLERKPYLSLYGAKLSEIATSCDILINIPKMKIHKMVYLTGAIKNMMGIMAQKGSMHPKGDSAILHKRLRDLYFLTRDMVHFCVLDGIEGSEYAETGGIPRKSGVLASCTDPWELDVVSAKLMGIKPHIVSYLEYIRRDLKRSFDEIEVPKHLIQKNELPLGLRE
jgi:uncharacterized protein (DUF362 family)